MRPCYYEAPSESGCPREHGVRQVPLWVVRVIRRPLGLLGNGAGHQRDALVASRASGARSKAWIHLSSKPGNAGGRSVVRGDGHWYSLWGVRRHVIIITPSRRAPRSCSGGCAPRWRPVASEVWARRLMANSRIGGIVCGRGSIRSRHVRRLEGSGVILQPAELPRPGRSRRRHEPTEPPCQLALTPSFRCRLGP